MKSKIVFNLFVLTSMLNVAAALFNVEALNLYTKPLLMPLLAYLLFIEAEGVITLNRLLLALALIFSWGGDVLLLFVAENELFFIGGLGSFLIAHLIYIRVFYKSTTSKIIWNLKSAIPFLVYGIVLLFILLQHTGELTPAVTLYALCILGMVITAAHRQGLANNESFRLVFSGAILFVISDSILALNKFVFEIPLGQVAIMVTYISAQYYIYKGVMAHEK